jgi:hypothetical protein
MEAVPHLAQRVSPTSLLGYLNFSDGRADPRFQRALNDAFAFLSDQGDPAPWSTLRNWLIQRCDELEKAGNAAFRETTQVRAIVPLAFDRVLAAYREHHTDLLAHLSDATVFNSFFLARVCEAVLAQAAPWDETSRIVAGAIQKLNDFAGHRPIAVLETRPQTEYYPHEKVRPIPLYIQGVGPAYGPYRELVERAVEILSKTDNDILADASFNPDHLEELALDPRAYDFAHPANRRANYMFGEWDPHCIDNHGSYRRFVVRQVVLDALLDHVQKTTPKTPGGQRAVLFEASAVLAGTMLMASGISGDGPEMHDSTAKLGNLLPKNARLRDSFYTRLVETVSGADGERLRSEAAKLKQPFGGIRRHLNHVLAKHRAAQLQDRKLALLFAELGFSEASRERAARIPTASARFLSEIHLRQTTAKLAIAREDRHTAFNLLPEIEDLLERGIDCGALADPWNILGFQGMYPLFQAREDSIPDPRIEELIEAVSRQFDVYARLLAVSASAGDTQMPESLVRSMKRLATWWDRFATSDVSDIPRLNGAERAEAALHVAKALAKWSVEFGKPREQSSALAAASKSQLQFWRSRREGFSSPAAFAQVIEALLRQKEWHAAMALIMTWLSEAETIPLEDSSVSFHLLVDSWLNGVIASRSGDDRTHLLIRFFELLEANADAFWQVPDPPFGAKTDTGDKESRYESAYEEMSYEDSTDDGEEGSVIGGGSDDGFSLEEEARPVEHRLEFLETVAKLWRKALPAIELSLEDSGPETEALASWLETARTWQRELLRFIDTIHAIEIPQSPGGLDEVIEFQRRKSYRDQLTDTAIDTCVEVIQAANGIAALIGAEGQGISIHAALATNDRNEVRDALPEMMRSMSETPLLFVPLSDNGDPRQIMQVRSTLSFFEMLFDRLPRLGLIRETYHLVKLAKSMEQNNQPEGRKVSDFERLYHVALRSIVETVLETATTANRGALESVLKKIVDSFLNVWIEHSQGLRLSTLELVTTTREWEQLYSFIREYGGDLFTTETMHLDTIRSILNRTTSGWLQAMAEQDSSEGIGATLLADIEKGAIERKEAARLLEIALQSVAENYDAYREYDATSTLSDYGENLHIFLQCARLRVGYMRFAWRMRPVMVAHEVLCRKGQDAWAEHWREQITDSMKTRCDQLLRDLDALEAEHGLRLQTIRDRLEERFLQPFLLDRLCALVEPAAKEIAQGVGEDGPAFQMLEEQLQPLTANPAGAGLETPSWLKRLETEVERVSREDEETTPHAGTVRLTLGDLQRQLKEWERSIDDE